MTNFHDEILLYDKLKKSILKRVIFFSKNLKSNTKQFEFNIPKQHQNKVCQLNLRYVPTSNFR